ncbi:putative Zn-dependent protease [Chitinivorax tropicus]|uniref:Putative Zn-dependent protease n=1 Tax=Chitinivorax tropicus TaxID=714531 RepID=A0A840MK22_9PROT|nr:TldD/PmbA family protein [Chitinivorax tropicus]MBB5017509.1 putative Zn-dependent protease [Chitinivorax tropicus]
MIEEVKQRFRQLSPGVEFCSLRWVEERSESFAVRQDIEQPTMLTLDSGVMITVIHRGGYGYAATSDISQAGLAKALEQAKAWAEASRQHSVFDYSTIELPRPVGQYQSPPSALARWSRRELLDLLMAESRACRINDKIVDWHAYLELKQTHQLYLTHDGAEVLQSFDFVIPGLVVTAFGDGDSQSRSLGGQYNGYCRQGGMEVIQQSGLIGSGRRVAEEALELLTAPNCPTGTMDLLLKPEQMMLQIHESIGHPLELDRILGDERNYAGTSFVTQDMFGQYQYGSSLLNVSYDPTLQNEFAAYGWDDEGTPGDKVLLIENGLLKRPLGGTISQARAGIPGVANSRACSWNRAPIDRMANLNVEPGDQTLDAMISSIEYGVMMDTNVSWSIDDSRNKFQFGCEKGWLIKDGQIQHVVKNPNYRGISATFWRSLKAVGDKNTVDIMGTPFCGKGEPSQVIRVGHASPACLFGAVEVFGGEA